MWNIGKRSEEKINNNGGFSLVEIIVAIAVGVVLLAGVSSLIFASLRFFGSNNANVEVQNESQRVMNLVVDNIMAAEGLCMGIPPSGGSSDCILLGDLMIEWDLADSGKYRVCFRGNVLAYSGAPTNEMYLIDLVEEPRWTGIETVNGEPYAVLATGADSVTEAAQEALDRVRKFVRGDDPSRDMSAADRLTWLMGSYVSACVIAPPNGLADLPIETITYVDDTTDDVAYFMEPFVLNIDLSFAYSFGNNTATRNITDDVSFRNRLKTIYVEDMTSGGRGMLEYQRR